MSIRVSASILGADFSRLRDEVLAVFEAGADAIHYDVMDNHFVPNLSFGFKIIEDLIGICPIKSDIHLMIEKVENSIDKFLACKPDMLTFHLEASTNPQAIIQRIRDAGVRPGLAIKPGTPVSVLEPYIKDIDIVLVMLVEPGFGGQSMMPETMDKIPAVLELARKQQKSIEVQVDGGIKADNYKPLVARGATNLVMGTGIFHHEDYAAVIKAVKAS